MVRGDVLQIVAFSVLFALAVSAIGEKGKPIIRAMDSLSQVMFKFTNYVMLFAPIGVGAAMAHTIGTQGPAVLLNLGKLIGSLYLALVIFIVFIFGLVIRITRIPLRQFVRAVREPAALAFATTSSESALRKRWNRWNVSACRRISLVRDANGVFVQSDRINLVSRNGVRVRRPSSRNDDGVAHVVRPTNHNDVDVDADFERSSWRAAGITVILLGA
jgi:Na+/H+-dicarboxylate symporters